MLSRPSLRPEVEYDYHPGVGRNQVSWDVESGLDGHHLVIRIIFSGTAEALVDSVP